MPRTRQYEYLRAIAILIAKRLHPHRRQWSPVLTSPIELSQFPRKRIRSVRYSLGLLAGRTTRSRQPERAINLSIYQGGCMTDSKQSAWFKGVVRVSAISLAVLLPVT